MLSAFHFLCQNSDVLFLVSDEKRIAHKYITHTYHTAAGSTQKKK